MLGKTYLGYTKGNETIALFEDVMLNAMNSWGQIENREVREKGVSFWDFALNGEKNMDIPLGEYTEVLSTQ